MEIWMLVAALLSGLKTIFPFILKHTSLRFRNVRNSIDDHVGRPVGRSEGRSVYEYEFDLANLHLNIVIIVKWFLNDTSNLNWPENEVERPDIMLGLIILKILLPQRIQ